MVLLSRETSALSCARSRASGSPEAQLTRHRERKILAGAYRLSLFGDRRAAAAFSLGCKVWPNGFRRLKPEEAKVSGAHHCNTSRHQTNTGFQKKLPNSSQRIQPQIQIQLELEQLKLQLTTRSWLPRLAHVIGPPSRSVCSFVRLGSSGG